MPQLMTIDPGPLGEASIPVDELEAGDVGFLVAADTGHPGAIHGEPIMRLGHLVKFFRSGILSDSMEHQVRRMLPGERVVFEFAAPTAPSPTPDF